MTRGERVESMCPADEVDGVAPRGTISEVHSANYVDVAWDDGQRSHWVEVRWLRRVS